MTTLEALVRAIENSDVDAYTQSSAATGDPAAGERIIRLLPQLKTLDQRELAYWALERFLVSARSRAVGEVLCERISKEKSVRMKMAVLDALRFARDLDDSACIVAPFRAKSPRLRRAALRAMSAFRSDAVHKLLLEEIRNIASPNRDVAALSLLRNMSFDSRESVQSLYRSTERVPANGFILGACLLMLVRFEVTEIEALVLDDCGQSDATVSLACAIWIERFGGKHLENVVTEWVRLLLSSHKESRPIRHIAGVELQFPSALSAYLAYLYRVSDRGLDWAGSLPLVSDSLDEREWEALRRKGVSPPI